MVERRVSSFLKSKKGEGDESKTISFLIKIILAIVVATALYFIIRRIGNAFLPK